MMYRRIFAALACSALLFGLTACDDPSNVGLGVGPDSLQGGRPVTFNVPPSVLQTETSPDVTGSINSPLTASRFLTGTVEDPIAGTVTTAGYVDFRSATSPSESFFEDELTGAELRLFPDSLGIHGDSTTSVSVSVYEVTARWEAQGATADQTFPTGATRVGEGTFSPRDSVVNIRLTDQWLQENTEVLRDTTEGGDSFEDRFHGFQLAATAGNAVVAFPAGTTQLRVAAGEDTTQYAAAQTFTHIERSEAPSLPDQRVVIQNGVGLNATFSFAFDQPPLDTLANASVNRAEIFLPIDSLTMRQSTPPNFVRPAPSSYSLRVRRAEGTPSCGTLGLVAVDSTSSPSCFVPVVATGRGPLVERSVAVPLFQQSLLRGSLFDQYILEISGETSTIPVLFFTPDASEADRPRVTLTITPV